MCEHKNERIIKTTGTHYVYQCLDCGRKRVVEKHVKLSKIEKIKRWFNGPN